MRARLTDLGVRALKPATKQYKVWDEQTPGFGVLIGGHTKTWFVMYGTKRTFKSLGRWPDVPLAKARKAALGYLSTQPDTLPSITFPQALDQFLAQDRWKPRSKYVLEHSLRWHC